MNAALHEQAFPAASDHGLRESQIKDSALTSAQRALAEMTKLYAQALGLAKRP